MAESAPALYENKSDTGPPPTTGVTEKSNDARKTKDDSTAQNYLRDKTKATDTTEGKKRQQRFRQPSRYAQQSRSTDSRKREVFEVAGGGSPGGRRRRERHDGGWKRKEGEERERQGEGSWRPSRRDRGEGEDVARGRDGAREKEGGEREYVEEPSPITDRRSYKERRWRGREREEKEDREKETSRGNEKRSGEGENKNESNIVPREREFGGRRRRRREREKDWEQERTSEREMRQNNGHQKSRQREYRGRGDEKGEAKTGNQEKIEIEKEAVDKCPEQENDQNPKQETSSKAQDEPQPQKAKETTSGDRGGVKDSEKVNHRKQRTGRRQPKEAQIRDKKVRDIDSNWRERCDDNETGKRAVSGSRYMYDMPAPVKRVTSEQKAEREGGRDKRPGSGREREGEKRGHKRNDRSAATHRKVKGKQVTPSLQSSELMEQLSSGSYSCMVCCDRIRDRDAVWSCRECYHVFHLSCIGKWATAPASLVNEKEPGKGWRCPACQNASDVVPTIYKCYCGKTENPRPRSRGDLTAPHSCGELCGRSLARNPQSSCHHKCQLLCHPGPCPPCPVMVTRSCPCGKQNYQVRCSKGDELPSCGSECGRRLRCGRHYCTQPCHSGSCGECVVMLSQQCYCGRSQCEVACGESGEEGEEGKYECPLTCGRELNCGNHLCELTCHPPPCPSCPLLPSHVTTCPCGATPLSALLSSDQSRTSCLDPVPTCDRSCGKVLPCSTKAEPHFCPAPCHEGPCPPCEKSRLVWCRCGRGNTRVDCQNLETAGQFVCDKPCNKMKSCGRHRCNNRCCVDSSHQCNLVCGKRLQCGNHNCMEPCHRGHCEQCWEYSYEELTCHCGAEVLYPPLPCGSRPPTCQRVCARMHSCDHPVTHSCHNEEECPPCTVLTVKMCMGEHEKRYNIPCHITEVSCGMPCGKELPCGRHSCLKTCHLGVCMDSPSQCRQPCQTPRKYCSHVCGEPCHTGSDCPDVPCKAEVVLTCKCGRMKERVMCGASSSGVMQQAFHKILSKDLGAKIRDLQSGQSVSLGRVSLASLGRDRETLDCDEVCAQIERNRALAEALGIASPVLDPLESPLPKYPPSLLDQARRDTATAASIEEELKYFIDLVLKGSGDQVRRHKFQPMASLERKMIHELAPLYGCESLSYDAEPLRHVTVSTKKSRAKLPAISLIKMLDREKLKVATPTLVNLPSERGSSPGRISGPLEIERTKSSAREPVTDYFADDLS